MIDYSKLTGIVPKGVLDELFDITLKYRIDTPLNLAHFLAQCDHESSNFRVKEENLRYSIDRLVVIFKKYFPTEDFALTYADEYGKVPPIAIASRVYANRMGNGSEESNEGWLYRGRGYIQLTGKDNYIQFDKEVNDNIVSNPDLVATKYPLLSAAWFWKRNNIGELANSGSTENEVALVTRKVNGGFIGLEHRTILFNKYYSLLK